MACQFLIDTGAPTTLICYEDFVMSTSQKALKLPRIRAFGAGKGEIKLLGTTDLDIQIEDLKMCMNVSIAAPGALLFSILGRDFMTKAGL